MLEEHICEYLNILVVERVFLKKWEKTGRKRRMDRFDYIKTENLWASKQSKTKPINPKQNLKINYKLRKKYLQHLRQTKGNVFPV